MNQEKELTISSKRIYDGKIIRLRVDTVELSDQKYSKREIIEHPGGVGILVIHQDRILLVKQFRKAIDRMVIEIPAGKLDYQEEAQTCATRELREETGVVVDKLIHLGDIYPSVGYTTEKIGLYFSDSFHAIGDQDLDEDESVEILWLDRRQFESQLIQGEIQDAKTIAAYSLAKMKGLIV